MIGQDNEKRRNDYINARQILCQEIMRADANQDGKVTLGSLFRSWSMKMNSCLFFLPSEEWLDFHKKLVKELQKADTDPNILEQISQRINTAFNMLDLNQDGFIAIDEWIKTCEFFGVDEKTAENSFRQITNNDRLEEDQAKQLFFQYLQSNDPTHPSNCLLCFL